MDLLQELLREKQTTIDGSQKVVTDANKLLAKASEEEEKIMEAAGLGEQIRKHETESKTTYIERTAMDEKYGGGVFSAAEIKNMCVKFGLRFLKAELYQGTVPAVTALKLKEFLEGNGIGYNNYLRNQCFVMAPDRAFRLQSAALRPAPDPDPILFYHIGEDKYKMIVKWGRDLTLWNYFKSFRRRDEQTYVIVNTLILNMVLMVTLALFGLLWWWMAIATFVVSFAANMIYVGWMENQYSEKAYTRDHVWNKDLNLYGV